MKPMNNICGKSTEHDQVLQESWSRVVRLHDKRARSVVR